MTRPMRAFRNQNAHITESVRPLDTQPMILWDSNGGVPHLQTPFVPAVTLQFKQTVFAPHTLLLFRTCVTVCASAPPLCEADGVPVHVIGSHDQA
jgi:hypothetical protein